MRKVKSWSIYHNMYSFSYEDGSADLFKIVDGKAVLIESVEGKKMDKIKVNETVAGWIENCDSSPNDAYTLHLILKNLMDENSKNPYKDFVTINDLLNNQGISLTELSRAIEEGYEIKYEFKLGDIIYSHYSKRFYEIGEELVPNKVTTLERMKELDYKYELICKKENREDKKVSND